jgi:1,2-diacylglycerol 3-alpha-glucosyltransferase
MRIGIFTDSYKPYVSGVVKSIDTFDRELRKKGHETFIFCPCYPNCGKEERVFRFASITAPTNRDFHLAIPLSSRISATIKRAQLDIVHVHSPFLMGNLGAWSARRHHLPLVFSHHSLYDQYTHYMPFLQGPSKQIIKGMGVGFSNKCSLVITPTGVVRDHLVKSGVRVPVVSIPTGLDMAEFASYDPLWLRRTFGIPNDHFVLLFVGRLGKEKNLYFLLQAFQRTLSVEPRVTLVLVGKGPEEESLRRVLEERGISRNVVFTGLQRNQNMVNCYAGADIFSFPSVTETQGLVLLEAKALGVPVVAVSAFGAREMVRHGEDGFLSPHDEAAFSRYLLTLLQNPMLRESMGRKAKENSWRFTAGYTTELLIKEYEKLVFPKAVSGLH